MKWQKRYGADGIYSFMSIDRAKDGNYFAVGMALPHGGKPQPKTWVVKFDPEGETIWQKTFAGQNKVGSSSSREIGQKETGTSFGVTSDGGLIVTGSNKVAGEAEVDFEVWIMKLDENGTIQWERTYGKPGTSSHGGVKVLEDGNLIIHGEMNSQVEAETAGLMMILNEKGELKNLEDTPLEPNPTNARTEVFPVSSTRGKIPYEEFDLPVSEAKIEVQEDDVGLEFLLKPRDN